MLMQPLRLLLQTTLFIAIITTTAMAQTPVKNYEKEWKKIDALIEKELPKSALTEVQKLYTLAKKEKQDAQVIKTLIYTTQLQQELNEDSEAKAIADMEKEIAGSSEPVTSILKSLTADLYLSYFQQHRYQIYNRTNTTNFNKKDIATWTADDLHKKISELYLASVKNEKLLQAVKLDAYNAIIIKGNMRHLRPTLYDLLAHRALDYYKNDERNVSKPAYAFEIDKASAFDPAADFVTRKFSTKDSLSLQHKALLLYQQLIAFHLNDAKPDALIDVDLERLQFVNDKSTATNKKELYRLALHHIASQYENLPAASQALYLLAVEYNKDANTYKPNGDTTHRFDRIKAKELCEKVLQQKDSSEGKINCYNLLNEINASFFSFFVEKVNVPQQPFRSLVEYRNVAALWYRIIALDSKLKEELTNNYYDEKTWAKIIKLPSVKNWQQQLPATNDLQQHSTEIKIDALPVGEYLIIASDNNDFDAKKSQLGARLTYVSNISYVNSDKDYFVLNRETGAPLAKATVTVWDQKYDYNTSKYTRIKNNSFTTDDKGYFNLLRKTTDNNSYNFTLEISHNNDHLFMNEQQYDYYYRNNGEKSLEEQIRVFLFTDRSIYRPGQTLYAKGIVIGKTSDRDNRIKTNYNTTVYLRDANYQNIDSANVTTNEFGSFNVTFNLPQSGLNGMFNLVMENNKGSQSFRVEEYKRPKFYVDYEKIKGTYKVNDSITVTGIAKAYAGYNIDNAMVKYRVVRQPRFIYYWMFAKWWQPPVQEMEIAHGEIKTGVDGKFNITFKAIPDASIDKKFDPVFDYHVYADVTDINGETRSGEQFVTVGYKSLLLKVNVREKMVADSLKNISVSTTNMSGEYEKAIVTVNIYKLKEEKRLIRKRYWNRPDQFVMSKEEYIKNFPNDEYDNETDEKSWERESLVYSQTDTSSANSKVKIKNSKIGTGFYAIEVITKDKEGNEIKDVQYTELYDANNKQLSQPAYLWTENAKPIEPGESTAIKLGSSAANIYLVQQVTKNNKNDFAIVNVNNEIKTFPFTATETDRGGFGVNYFFVKNNRFYIYNGFVAVPWSNKDLQIEYATYRDKTLPGSEEKWKLKISGYKNEKLAAEMLASMYDASLDQFYPHNWNEPNIWPYFSNYKYWNGQLNFSSVVSNEWSLKNTPSKLLNKNYDYLINTQRRIIYDRVYSSMRNMSAPNTEAMASGKLDEVVVTAGIGNFEKKEIAKKADTTSFANGDFNKEINNQQSPQTQIRKNFNETAFFFPQLHTDSSGAIEFSFTLSDALTKWKFQALAHTKDLAFGYSSKEVVTQKDLMVQPNAPRFLREGDRMEFSAKIVNLSDKELTGQAQLELLDATTNQPVDGWFINSFPNQYFTVAAGQSEAVKFPLQVPYLFNKAVVWRIVARAGNFSDGEENALPVLTNKILVTETLPLNMKGSGSKEYKFEKLLNNHSETLQHQSLTVEYTSNPAWYAVQSLPYLMEYPYECAEQTWNRYYANALASMIANASPKIKAVFSEWSKASPSGGGLEGAAALLSNLQKNQELKSILLEETPWVLDAKNETEQKKKIALLFDMVRMSSELSKAYEKLKQMQSPNGGFVWFSGGPDDRYITQYILTGIGHLKKINGIAEGQDAQLKTIIKAALPYLDKKIKEDYDWLVKNKAKLTVQQINYTQVQYLYMRSFFKEYEIAKASQAAYNYYYKQAQQFWTKQSKYMQGMIALATARSGDTKTPAAILKSLKETSITNEELGMYWKELNNRGWFWYEAPVETQALLIEAFQEAGNDKTTADALRTWLLKNKQTNNWSTTKATAEACYALLLQGSDWITTTPDVEIDLGHAFVKSTADAEAGTGYIKKTIEGRLVNNSMGNITVKVQQPKASPTGGGLEGAAPSWGAVYWQYFENMDQVTSSETPLKLVKKLFVEKNTDHGPVLTPVNESDELKVGDKLKVRIELRVDRNMEYVHMKDMRAAATEPVNVLSSYKWQGGLGYYESTKDVSTNFFFSYLQKGTYVFEYPLFVTHAGNFSNGITTIQCMYAPEFSAHSEGIRINVE